MFFTSLALSLSLSLSLFLSLSLSLSLFLSLSLISQSTFSITWFSLCRDHSLQKKKKIKLRDDMGLKACDILRSYYAPFPLWNVGNLLMEAKLLNCLFIGTKIAKNCIYSFFCNTVQIHMVNQRWNAIDRKRNASACIQL